MGRRLNLLIGIREENLSELLNYHSSRNNLEVETFSATSGKELRNRLSDHNYHAVISDYYLGDETAINILKNVKPDLPFIIHTKYNNGLLEQKALKNGASAMIQKSEHLKYYNELLQRILVLSDEKEFDKNERNDIKFRIDKDGEIIQMNGVPRKVFDPENKIFDISDYVEDDQIKEAIQETIELGSSAAEVVFEDRKGLVNYRLTFKLLDNWPGIAVTGIPMEELQKIDREAYAEVSGISSQPIKD